MPARHFDRGRLRAVRRAAEIYQVAVGEALGVSDSAVAGWETGAQTPDPEKLPALARALGQDVDDLFPRSGPPDLTDLRCDAGYYQYETAELIGTKSAGPVAAAERGERRLKDKYVPALAAAYGVSPEELRRAEARSIAKAQGVQVDEPAPSGTGSASALGTPPESLAEKITLLLNSSYPGPQGPPSDAEMANAVNAHAGAQIITEEGFRDLRTGITGTASPAVLDALSAVVGVSRMYFEPDAAVAAQVYEGLQLLAAAKKGAVGRVRARGLGSQGLSPKAMALVNELVAELEEKEADAGE
ncbi:MULTISPECIES: helix-turn-helix transcriptional regulator [unclassified Streptomyces]|uniref:helix-turn-helix transcriptional regulator n=1 Tax=unclassified Streptomyces TaxID=2593676 RepID=UPI000DABB558|nr:MULTISPECIES: helix-turn-helix transcriptional regulator [unclassified Streptomyces]PZT74144.1 DNA-binding protein [Streptomyces sp. AC1-42T]PZT82867.1 DNA-binding protein [Streptomyces sp. AC1-42W]